MPTDTNLHSPFWSFTLTKPHRLFTQVFTLSDFFGGWQAQPTTLNTSKLQVEVQGAALEKSHTQMFKWNQTPGIIAPSKSCCSTEVKQASLLFPHLPNFTLVTSISKAPSLPLQVLKIYNC